MKKIVKQLLSRKSNKSVRTGSSAMAEEVQELDGESIVAVAPLKQAEAAFDAQASANISEAVQVNSNYIKIEHAAADGSNKFQITEEQPTNPQ